MGDKAEAETMTVWTSVWLWPGCIDELKISSCMHACVNAYVTLFLFFTEQN